MSDRSKIRHCPNPACPHLEKHKVPAEFESQVTHCSDCGAQLIQGKGSFDQEDLKAARPLDVLCTKQAGGKSGLGKQAGQALVLASVPGATSGAVIRLIFGAAVVVGSLVFIHRGQYWAILGLAVGFVFFYQGVDEIKKRQPIVRKIQPHQAGFIYHAGQKAVALSYHDIDRSALVSRPVGIRMVQVGVRHELILAYNDHLYGLASFEASGGLTPRETDAFVLWARNVVSLVQRRRAGHPL